MVKIFYNKPLTCIKNNGWISSTFQIYREIRQGCPHSALQFIIAMEILAVDIRTGNTIKEYTLTYAAFSK
jgi:hypothetical protein